MKQCFICNKTESDYFRLERHHIFGGANRKLSEKYGLTVDLCHTCHNEPPNGVHFNKDFAAALHRYGQITAMRENGWTIEKFTEIFGKNYL